MSDDKVTEYPALFDAYDSEEDAAKAHAHVMNWQSEQIAKMAAQTQEMYDMFAMLKPMAASMPKLPGGMVMPTPGIFPRR